MNVLISILIPVRNGQDYLNESILSCTKQITTYDFEIIVVDDGSTDRTSHILEELARADKRIKVFTNPSPGLCRALNLGIKLASGSIILRHDADDIMLPQRLELQVKKLLQDKDLVVLGGQMNTFGSGQKLPTANRYPTDPFETILELADGNALAHPTVAFWRDHVIQIGGYRESFDGAEDYDLWLRMSRLGYLYSLDCTVTNYRVHENQITRKRRNRVIRATILAQLAWIISSLRHIPKPLHNFQQCASYPVPATKMFFRLLGLPIRTLRKRI